MWVWESLYKEFLQAYNIEYDKSFLTEINHFTLSECVSYTINKFSLNISHEQALKQWVDLANHYYQNKVCLKPGAKEFLLSAKKKNILLGVATALPYDMAKLSLESLHVFNLIHSMTSLDEVNVDKSKPDIYLKQASKMKLDPSDCVVFEDSHIGIMSAKKAGFTTVGVYDSYSYNDLLKRKAHKYIKDFTELEIT
jgi:HAD superfamily hydrolase (TIGR01509 family)